MKDNYYSFNSLDMKVIIANIVGVSNVVFQSIAFDGETFRLWSSWAIAMIIGILTTIKLCIELKNKKNQNENPRKKRKKK